MEKDRYFCLDIFKGVLIVFVIINHSGISDEKCLKLLFPFWVYMAVPFFMTISGYVSALSFKKNNIIYIKEGYKLKTIAKKNT